MSDAFRLAASQYLMYGRFVPGGIATPEGFDGSRPHSCRAGMSARGLCFFLRGKVQEYAGAISVVSSRKAAARFERELSMERGLVALSTASGDGLSGREPQSSPIRFLHRGAIE
jgi:hypothetical protein